MNRLLRALAASVLPVCIPCASAQSWIAETFGTSGVDVYLGSDMAVLGDVDGDGLPDVAVSAKDALTLSGTLRILAGHDLSLIRNVTSPVGDASFATAIAALDDLDGDGVPELAASSPQYPQGSEEWGLVEIFSGATGSVLHTLNGAFDHSQLGVALASLPDLDGDGLGELAATTLNIGSAIHVYSPSTWNLLLSFPGGVPFEDATAICSPGDVDLDGLPDLAIGESSGPDRVQIFSTATGRVLLYSTEPSIKSWGFEIAPMGDVDGDGMPDLAVGAPGDATLYPANGSVHVISCETGETLQAVYGHQGQSLFGAGLCAAGDVDGDGMPDFAVGAQNSYPSMWTAGYGDVQFRSTADGSLLTHVWGKTHTAAIGRHLVGPFDFNGDGYADVLVGSLNDGTAGPGTGAVAILSARFRLTQLEPPDVIASNPGTVALHGAGFDAALPISITVAGTPASSVTWLSPDLVTFTPPAGAEDTYADVVYEQDGLQVVADDALRYGGPELLDIYPTAFSTAGGDTVRFLGRNFATDGSAIVKIYAGTATIQSISENEIVMTLPPYTPGSPFTVQVLGSTGSVASSEFGQFAQKDKYGSPNRGNLVGGTICVLKGLEANHSLGMPKAFVGLGGSEAPILSLTPTTMTIEMPPLQEPNGAMYEIFISDPIKGNEKVTYMFEYTPYLKASYAPEALGGGLLSVQVLPDPAAAGPQLLSAWIGPLFGSPTALTVPGFAGVLHEEPWLFLAMLQPLPQPLPVLDFAVPPYDPLAIGLELRMQAHLSGEGLAKGSFTNTVSIKLP